MKRSIINSVVAALILIFAVSTYAFIGTGDSSTPKVIPSPRIAYVVNVTLSGDKQICGNYVIALLNEYGNPVAPPKAFIQGVSTYYFYELRHEFLGTRTAKMAAIQSPGDWPVCNRPMYATPQSLFNWYVPGQYYQFNLFPTNMPPHP